MLNDGTEPSASLRLLKKLTTFIGSRHSEERRLCKTAKHRSKSIYLHKTQVLLQCLANVDSYASVLNHHLNKCVNLYKR